MKIHKGEAGYLKKRKVQLMIELIMMKTLQNIWKHKREFQINIFSFIRKIRI